MRSYSQRKVFSAPFLDVLALATSLVERVDHLPPKEDAKYEVRCHELARAVVHCLRPPLGMHLTVIDGKYNFCEHSWIHVQGGNAGERCILDVYSVGRLPQVQLVALDPLLHHQHTYQAGAKRIDIRSEIFTWMCEQMMPGRK